MKLKRIMAIVLCFAMVLSTMSFNVFAEESVTETTFVAKIGDVEYTTFDEALSKTSGMTGDVTVEIYNKVTLAQSLSGSYDSITFIGKGDDAEIYLDVQGYITAPGKAVAFEELTLSKSEGGYLGNAGFMNVAFGIYDVDEVTYTNCEFINGAYASSGEVTFTDCTFYRSHDKYGLWAYGDVDTTVEKCTFAGYRGIKMYAEGKEKTVNLTVKNTDFSALDNKPAIVLTYGESVTLEDNTYSDTGVFELDLDGEPNGTEVTSDVAPTCKNDSGACGVLVDGKIYTTVAQAAEVAISGSTVTLLHDSTETVEFDEGVILDKGNFTAENVTVNTPVAKVNGVSYTTLKAAIEAANAGDTVTIMEGTYAVPSMKAGITIEGGGNVLLEGTLSGSLENLTLKNLHIKGSNAQRWAYAKGDLVFENVTFEATSVYALHFDGITEGAKLLYKDCTIIGWAAMGGSPESCVFDGCTFKDNGKYGLIRTFFDSEIKNCTFDVDGADQTDAYQDGIHAAGSTIKVYNCTNENGELMDIINATSSEAGDRAYVYVDDNLALVSSVAVKVSTKDELNEAIKNASDKDTITLTADIDYGSEQLKLDKPIILDLGGKTLTTSNAWGGMSVKNNPTIKNGTIVHASNTAAIKVWNATAFEDLVIDVQGKGDANKTIGGIVLQSGTTTRVDSMKNVTIKGVALTNGIETYNCGDATEDVIGSMENVSIDALGTGMLISAPCGTATNCEINGGKNGIEIWIKGNYSAKLDLVDCDVVGGVYAHDEFNSNPGIQNIGTISLTADANSTGADEDDITLTIARAENVEGVLETVMNNSQAKVGDTYYPTFGAAIEAAQNGDTVTLLADVKLTGKFNVAKEITIDGNGHSIIADTNGNWVKNPSAFIKQYNHLLGVNSNNVTLKNIVLDNNNNAGGINLYRAQNVVFDNVSIVNATKGMAALTVNGSTITFKNKFEALGNSVAMDISNGSGVTSNLGITVEQDTVFNLADKTVKFASVANNNVSGAVNTEGEPYFVAMDSAYLYTENQINNRTTAFSNGLTLISDVELSKVITVKGTLNINGKTLTIPENKELDVKYNLEIVKAGGTINGGFNITSADAKITAEKGLDVSTNLPKSAVVYANGVYQVAPAVAKIGEKLYGTLADALGTAQNGDKVELIWNEGDAPIAMNGAVFGKSITVTGDATVDWSKGFLFVGRGGEGNGTVIFDKANLKSASNSSSYGIHVSGREKDTDNKYDGTLVINNSTIELDYLINKGTMALDNSTLTVKNGFSIGGRPASETESGVDTTATLDLKNGSKVVVNNHNGMGLGYEAIGVMNIDKTSAFECTQNFLITAKGTMNVNGGNVNVDGNLEVKGTLKSNGNVFGNIVAADTAVIELTGGLYTQDVTEWCADGYKCSATKDGKYMVYPDFTVEAIANVETAKAGDTITVQVKVTKGGNYTNADWVLKYDPRYVTYLGTDDKNYKISGKEYNGTPNDGYDEFDSDYALGTYTFTVNELTREATAVFEIVDAHVHNYAMSVEFDGVEASKQNDIVAIKFKTADREIDTKTVPYNGMEQRGNGVADAPANATITYSKTEDFTNGTQLPPAFVNVGTHTYYAQIKLDGYATKVVEGTLVIEAKGVEPSVEWMVAPESDKVEFIPVIKGVVDDSYKNKGGKVTVTGQKADGTAFTYEFDDMSKFAYDGHGKAVYTGAATELSGIKGNELLEVTVKYIAGTADNYANGENTASVYVNKSTINDTMEDKLATFIKGEGNVVYDGQTHYVTVDAAELKKLGWTATVATHNGVTYYGDVEVVDVTFTDTTGMYNDYTATVMIKTIRRNTVIYVNNATKKNGQKDSEATGWGYTATTSNGSGDAIIGDDLGEIKIVRANGQTEEVEGTYDITATYTPNDNYIVRVENNTLTITDAVYFVEVVDNAHNGNEVKYGADTKSDYTAGSVANGNIATKMILVHTDADYAFFTYKGEKMYDVTDAGYHFVDHNYTEGSHTTDKKYQHVYAIVVDAEYGDVTSEEIEAMYTRHLAYAGKDATAAYAPVKVTYDADINDKSNLHTNDYSTVKGVYGGIYSNSRYQISILKADYNKDKIVNTADAIDVKNAVIGE